MWKYTGHSYFLTFLLLCYISQFSHGQSKRANNWYFTSNAGIDFNQEPPAPLLEGQVNTPIEALPA